jgi:hypothetical protein
MNILQLYNNRYGGFTMNIIKMSVKQNNMFNRALHACVKAFGCICTPMDDDMYITCFEEGDDEVIKDTLEATGSEYEGFCTMDEYLEVFA